MSSPPPPSSSPPPTSPSRLSRLFETSIPFLIFWLFGCLMAIVIPVRRWKEEKRTFYKYKGYYIEYEQQQRQYEENQQGNYNQYNYNNYKKKDPCSWWQWACKHRYQSYRRNGGENQVNVPYWYHFFGGKMEEERQEDKDEIGEMPGTSGSLKFIYSWTLILFLLIVAFGGWVIYRERPVTPIVITLIIFMQFSFMGMLMAVQGVIETDGRLMDDSPYGWYGQWGVLIFLSDFSYTIYCFCFIFIFAIRSFINKRLKRKEAEKLAHDEEYQTEYRQVT